MGCFAAEFGFFDGEAAGKICAGKREGDDVADFIVAGAADDLACGFAVGDLADAEAVGIGMFGGGEDFCGDDVGDVDAGFFDGFDFGAAHGEFFDELVGSPVEVAIFVEPIERDFHKIMELS